MPGALRVFSATASFPRYGRCRGGAFLGRPGWKQLVLLYSSEMGRGKVLTDASNSRAGLSRNDEGGLLSPRSVELHVIKEGPGLI